MISVVELYRKMVFTIVFSKFYRKTVALVGTVIWKWHFRWFWYRKSVYGYRFLIPIFYNFTKKYANFTQNTQKFTQNTQSLRNFRGVDHSKIFEPLPRNTHFLLKVRKFYAKYAKFTQNTQILHTKNEKPCLNNANFTQILSKIYANYANLRKSFLRSFTKILSGQPLGAPSYGYQV